MSQISRPLQVALVAAVGFALLWFVFLRPKSPAPPPPGPPPAGAPAGQAQTPFGEAAQKAQGAKQNAETAAGARAGEQPSPAPAGAAAGPAAHAGGKAPAKPRGAARGAPAAAPGKVLVLLFWNRASTDDRAVRRAVEGVDTRRGKVRTVIASLEQLPRFQKVLQGTRVVQSPTVVIVGPDGRVTRRIDGYTETREIEQAVANALHK